MTFPARLGCSTISFQHRDLEAALADIAELGFSRIDLGALPGVCDHVPSDLDERAVADVARTVRESGLVVSSVNGDTGDLNDPEADREARRVHLERLLDLTASIGADALVLPCGALDHEPVRDLQSDLRLVADELLAASEAARAHGVRIWVESLHYLRLSWNLERAAALHAMLDDPEIGIVLDVAHVVASGGTVEETVSGWGSRIAHVHLRDAVPGDFSRAIGAGVGAVDFPAAFRALEGIGYAGGFAIEMPSKAYSDDATDAVVSDELLADRRERIRLARDAVAPFIPAA